MKRIMFLMMVAIVISQVVYAQTKGDFCAPLKQNRTLAEMQEFLMKDGLYYKNLRNAYAEAVSFAIDSVVSPDKDGVMWILGKTIFVDKDFIIPDQFENGVRYGDLVSFTNLIGQPSDNWAAIKYRGEDHPYAKVSCMNAEKIKPEYKKTVKKQPKSEKLKEDELTTNKLPQDFGGLKKNLTPCSILSFIATPNSFKKRKGTFTLSWETNNTTFVNVNEVGDSLLSSGSVDMDVFFAKRGDSIAFKLDAFNKNGFCKSKTIYVWRKPMTNRLIFKNLSDWIEGPIYVLIIEETLRRWVIPAFTKVEPRTMPEGLDSNPNNGGLSSDPRGMPSGLGFTTPKNMMPKTFGINASFYF